MFFLWIFVIMRNTRHYPYILKLLEKEKKAKLGKKKQIGTETCYRAINILELICRNFLNYDSSSEFAFSNNFLKGHFCSGV